MRIRVRDAVPTIALALIAFGGCTCGNSSSTSGLAVDDNRGPADKAAESKSAPLAGKEFYRVDAAAEQPACQVGAACEAHLVLTALGDYHVNDNYPFKFVDASSSVKVDGTGTFEPKGKKGTLALPFRATTAGTAKLAGTFKLSVCNNENCQIESPKIAFEVPVR